MGDSLSHLDDLLVFPTKTSLLHSIVLYRWMLFSVRYSFLYDLCNGWCKFKKNYQGYLSKERNITKYFTMKKGKRNLAILNLA